MQKKKGISLIVLVITIIVMIILAAAIILSLNNAGIIGNANKAVNDSNIANIKSAADLAYAEYLIDKPEGVTDLGKYLTQKLVDNNTITGDDYVVGIYDGETVVAKAGTVAYEYYKGNIRIGEYVNYDPSKGVEDASSVKYNSPVSQNGFGDQEFTLEGSYDNTTYGWQVMGINKEGELLLLSEYIIQPTSGGEYDSEKNVTWFGFKSIKASGKDENREVYKNISTELKNICEIYGKGYGATGARCINIEDVNRITGYNPKKTGNGQAYEKGNIEEYNNNVTYYWYNDGGENIEVYYECTNGVKGKLTTIHEVFEWYEGNQYRYQEAPENLEVGKKQKITTLTSNCYKYYPETLTYDENNDEVGKVHQGTLEYSVLFSNPIAYWLDTPMVRMTSGEIRYCISIVYEGKIGLPVVFCSNGNTSYAYPVEGIRPVVSLNKDIVLEPNGTKMVGDIQVNVYDIK